MSDRFSIYCHTNTVNGKCYVGQTLDTVEERWNEHVSAARRNTGCPILGAAIRKYGASAFTHELLDVVTTQNGANIAETRWIEQRGSLKPNGYNLTSGGGGLGRLHEDSKRLIGAASKKRLQEMTPEQRAAYFLMNIHAWTPERRARQKARVKTAEHAQKVSAAQKELWAKLTPEERSRKALHQSASMSKEQKSERVRKAWMNATPERRAERIRKTADATRASMGPAHSQKMSEWQTEQAKKRTPEQRKEIGQKAAATRLARYGKPVPKVRPKLTEDQIREAKKRAWETRRAKYGRYGLKKAAEHRRVKLTAEQRSEVAKQNWANRRAKYGEFGAKQKKTPEELAEIGKKIWATRRLNKAK